MSNATQTLLTTQLERQLRNGQLADQIANRNYEGEVTGPEDTVKILVAQNGTVQDYTGGAISIETTVDGTPASRAMDHKKAFSFLVDGSTNLTRYAEQLSAETFAEVLEEADKRILQEANNAANTPGTWTAGTDDVADLFSDARTQLNEDGVPAAGRTAVIPSSAGAEVYKAIQDRDTARGDAELDGSMIGRYFGFRVFERPSSFFPTSNGNPLALFSSQFKMTYADAVVAIQVIEQAPGFPGGVVVQGLHCAGVQLTEAEGAYATEIA